MKVGIIGGGITGLFVALKLSELGHEIDIYEKESQPGGLATYHNFNGIIWDRFYHVILPTDKSLLNLIKSIGLEESLNWKQTFTGVYVDKKFYSVSNTKEFLKFPPLNLIQKFRLGLTILVGSRIKNGKDLEQITTEEWLIKYSGQATYEKFWKPMLIAKLGNAYNRVSAVFIWSYIKRLFEARGDSTTKKEAMAYVKGGYKTILDELSLRLEKRNCNVFLNAPIDFVEELDDGKIQMQVLGDKKVYAKVIFTAPIPTLKRIVPPSFYHVKGNLNRMEYLSVICHVLILKKEITPFYVLNIADRDIPFTGVIGMSTLVDKKELGGNYMVYLPKYIEASDKYWEKKDEEIEAEFLIALMGMYPELSRDDIVSSHINRAKVVQPLQVKGYSDIVPSVISQKPNFYVLNSSQIMDSTLNNNSISQLVNGFIKDFIADFS